MSRCRVGRGVVLTLAVAAIIASCGGSDGGGENGAAPATGDADTTASTDSPATADSAGALTEETDDSIGDLANTSGSAGMDYAFVDEPVGGSVNEIAFDMESADAQPLHTPEDVEQLFRTSHDRVT